MAPSDGALTALTRRLMMNVVFDDSLPSNLNQTQIEEIAETFEEIRSAEDGDWEPPHPSSDSRIWRYISFTQLLSLLEQDQLWFTNITNFDDPYEGTLPNGNIQREIKQFADQTSLSKEQAEEMYSTAMKNPSVTDGYVNCWNQSEHESAALWEQYVESAQGVAVTTTVDNLENAIQTDQKTIFGEVEYIDYERDEITSGSIPPIYHKRKSFEHENEFRACIIPEEEDNGQIGTYVDIDTDVLIDAIYLAPTTQEWFYELIDKVLDTYEVDCSLEQSDLYSDRVY